MRMLGDLKVGYAFRAPPPVPRIAAVDALRGLAILLLVPDVYGGFSFYIMARQQPDSVQWSALATQFTHVAWRGVALWDLIMPVFVFVVGVSMALSGERNTVAPLAQR
jgi:predicted acyltransferase